MIRVPLCNEAAAFSPSVSHATTLKNETFSCHSPFTWKRRLTASPKLATPLPPPVKRSSGSRVMLPTRVTELSAMGVPSSGSAASGCGVDQAAARRLGVGQTDELVADDVVRDAERAL